MTWIKELNENELNELSKNRSSCNREQGIHFRCLKGTIRREGKKHDKKNQEINKKP